MAKKASTPNFYLVIYTEKVYNTAMSVLKKKVLLLNQSFEPLAVLPMKRVLSKIVGGSTSFIIEEWYDGLTIKSMPLPSVVRLTYHLKLRKKAAKAPAIGKRRKIFSRDQYKCVYCETPCTPDELTIDHVLPKSRGGDNSPQNLVTCCRRCNSLKDSKTDEEFGYRVSKAVLHSNIDLAILLASAKSNPQWKKYLFQDWE